MHTIICMNIFQKYQHENLIYFFLSLHKHDEPPKWGDLTVLAEIFLQIGVTDYNLFIKQEHTDRHSLVLHKNIINWDSAKLTEIAKLW